MEFDREFAVEAFEPPCLQPLSPMSARQAAVVQPAASVAPDSQIQDLQGWNLSSRSRPISASATVDAFAEETGIKPPEMVFLENRLSLEHPASGLRIEFRAHDALLRCRNPAPAGPAGAGEEASSPPKKGSAPVATPVKCKSAELWQGKNMPEIEHLQLDYDWTYTTLYNGSEESESPLAWERTEDEINLPLLMRREPILWFSHVILFEDELHDNGVSQLYLKARAMSSCWLILLRFWLRVDDVLTRVYDTRYFVEFGKPYLIREQQLREASAEQLAKMGIRPQSPVLNDPDQLARVLPLRNQRRQRVLLKVPQNEPSSPSPLGVPEVEEKVSSEVPGAAAAPGAED